MILKSSRLCIKMSKLLLVNISRMRNLLFLILILNSAEASILAQEKKPILIHVPLRTVPGYGPIPEGFSGPAWESSDSAGNPFYKTNKPVKGIPGNWQHIRKGMIWINPIQFFYQEYIAGSFSEPFFRSFQQHLPWPADESSLSKKPLACYACIASGEDAEGKVWVVVDTDHDGDFSDETPFIPELLNLQDLSAALHTIRQVSVESMVGGRLVKDTVPVIFIRQGSSIEYSIPQHARAPFSQDGKKYILTVSSIYDPNAFLLVRTPGQQHDKASPEELHDKGAYVAIGRQLYRNKGVDIFKRTLTLEKIKDPGTIYSAQPGYQLPPFKGSEFTTGQVLSPAPFRGKYLLLLFWGTWCVPCMGEIKHLQSLYGRLNKDTIAILGIAGRDTPEALRRFLNKEKIPWPLLLSDDRNKIVESFGILTYPTTLLVDPDGKIIAKDLLPGDLERLPGYH
jgi:peroxiredoxin